MAQQVSGSSMDEEVRRELLDAVLQAHDFDDLKAKLLTLLRPAAAVTEQDGASVQASRDGVATRSQAQKDLSVKPTVASTQAADKDATPAAASSVGESETVGLGGTHPCGVTGNKGIDGGKKTKAKPPGSKSADKSAKPMAASNISQTETEGAKPTGASNNSASADRQKVWLSSVLKHKGTGSPITRTETISVKHVDASTRKSVADKSRKPTAQTPQVASTSAQRAPASSSATAETETNVSSEDTGIDGDGFQTVVGKKQKLAGKQKQASAPAPKRTPPLVLEGASEAEKANPIRLKHLIAGGAEFVRHTVKTKVGTVLIFPRAEEDSEKLLSLHLREGLHLRPTRNAARAARQPPTVIIVGMHPSIEDEEISEETGLKCTRIVSSQLNGKRTWKVKMLCQTETERNSLLKSGITVGLQHYKCVEYKHSHPVMQCFKCQGFDHISTACPNEVKCRRCGSSHSSKDCADSSTIRCANCNGSHAASDFSCPVYKSKIVAKDSAVLSYASAVKKSGDTVECVRLACTVAKSLTQTLKDRLRMEVSETDICNDVAESISQFYKVNVRGEYVYNIAFNSKGAASNPQHG